MLKHAVKSCFFFPVANSGGKVASLSKIVCVNGNFSESLMEPIVGGSPRFDPDAGPTLLRRVKHSRYARKTFGRFSFCRKCGLLTDNLNVLAAP